MAKQKRSKEEREEEFVKALEQVFSFRFLPWQRAMVLAIRQASLAGESIEVNQDMVRQVRESWGK